MVERMTPERLATLRPLAEAARDHTDEEAFIALITRMSCRDVADMLNEIDRLNGLLDDADSTLEVVRRERDEARAELEKTIRHYMTSPHEGCNCSCCSAMRDRRTLIARCDAFERSNAALVKAVEGLIQKAYYHHRSCEIDKCDACTCGLDAALASAEAAVKEAA